MEEVMHFLHTLVTDVVNFSSLMLELFGAAIMVYTGVKGFILWVTNREESSINLGEGIAMTLEFLMAGEVLHTIVAQNVSDLIILGALVILRGIMTYEIHWELKHEKEHLAEHRKEHEEERQKILEIEAEKKAELEEIQRLIKEEYERNEAEQKYTNAKKD